MNLPHLQQNPASLPVKQKLGKQTMRALTMPRVVPRTGRQTGYDTIANSGFGGTLPLPDPSASWRTLETQRKHLLNLPYSRLAQIALDLSPAVNKGMSDFLRFANPAVVLKNENERAERATRDFIRCLDSYYGSFGTYLDSIWAGIFITGGTFLELVLDQGGRAPADIASNNPLSARFRKEIHPIRGWRWRLGQETVGEGFKYYDDDPLVKYLGFDRLVDNPYGRPVLGPSVHSSIFLLGLIQDLRRVIANQGLSRIDYALDIEELLTLIDRNPDIAGDDEATAQFINEQIDSIQRVLADLEVDQDYVHASTVEVNYANNPVTVNMNGLNIVIETLQRNIVNGFKGVSALSNVLDSTTETHIRSQLEYYVSAIQSLQNEVADVFTTYFDIANQVQGIPGETIFMFRRQRTADKKATAEIEKIRTDTVIAKQTAGIISDVEAREEIDQFRDELEVAI